MASESEAPNRIDIAGSGAGCLALIVLIFALIGLCSTVAWLWRWLHV